MSNDYILYDCMHLKHRFEQSVFQFRRKNTVVIKVEGNWKSGY